MSDSDATVLENYKLARDALIAAITAGEDMVEFEIRGRRVKYEATTGRLQEIEKFIRYYENRTASGSARNFARLKRPS